MRRRFENATVNPAPDTENVTGRALAGATYFAQRAKDEGLARSSMSALNYRGALFQSVHAALDTMKSLPEWHDLHLDSEVADRAQDLLGVLRWNFDVDAPKIFPQEQDVLVMKWYANALERFLSVTPEEVDLLDINSRSGMRCVHDVTEDGEVVLSKLHSVLSLPERNSTVPEI